MFQPAAAPNRVIAAAAALVVLTGLPAGAQDVSGLRATYQDLIIGKPIGDQPTDFQEFACGTNGGPPSLRIDGFADYAKCRPEESGLREVQFQYDDEPYYRSLAARDAWGARAFLGTRIGNFQVVVSALFDDAGILRGIRAVTNNGVSTNQRRNAYALPEFVRSLYGVDGWQCTEIPPNEGETPIAGRLVKEDCRRAGSDGLLITTEARLLHREGQTLIDPANGQLRPGLFESTGRMEIYRADASGQPVYGDVGGTPAARVAEAVQTPALSDPVQAFLAGQAKDCPGCDLTGANLKRRDLAGADLSGANLAGANLHRAKLGKANLAGANLRGANLNVADLKRASLAGADLTDALLYEADASAADLTGATLDRANVERSRLTSAKMAHVHGTSMYGLAANVAGADLTGAVLTETVFYEADLQRANFSTADVTDVSFYKARLRSANLRGATAVRADFLEADLSDADFAGADLTDARLLRARISGSNFAEANTTGTVMPDGNAAQ